METPPISSHSTASGFTFYRFQIWLNPLIFLCLFLCLVKRDIWWGMQLDVHSFFFLCAYGRHMLYFNHSLQPRNTVTNCSALLIKPNNQHTVFVVKYSQFYSSQAVICHQSFESESQCPQLQYAPWLSRCALLFWLANHTTLAGAVHIMHISVRSSWKFVSAVL